MKRMRVEFYLTEADLQMLDALVQHRNENLAKYRAQGEDWAIRSTDYTRHCVLRMDGWRFRDEYLELTKRQAEKEAA